MLYMLYVLYIYIYILLRNYLPHSWIHRGLSDPTGLVLHGTQGGRLEAARLRWESWEIYTLYTIAGWWF